jgi:hypothetical protein
LSAEQFSQWINGVLKDPIPPEDDKILYEIGKRFGIQSFLIRLVYCLWRRDRNAVTPLDHAEKR